MPRFNLICNTVLDDAARASLQAEGVYVTSGAETPIGSERKRHHLQVEAETPDEAVGRVRAAVERAGADASDIEVA